MQFVDLAAQQARIKHRLDARIQAVMDHGTYIMGPEVLELEEQLAAFCGARHCISCANGTDALQLVLMAMNVAENDAIFVPSFTFAATIEVVPLLGATPVMVDVDRATFNMDAESLRRAIAHAREKGLKPKAIIAVDLFGLRADYKAISQIAEVEGITVISDSAQSFGGTIDGAMTGSFAPVMTTSFFPAKPLGCYGDGGAIFTDNHDWAMLFNSMRFHGKGTEKYDNVRVGVNSRLDTIQAAILLEKLAIYADEIGMRNVIADRYNNCLQDRYETPFIPRGHTSVWAQYALKVPAHMRADLVARAKGEHIPMMVYYPRPLHQQLAYRDSLRDPAGLETSERLASEVLCLPMHSYLNEADQNNVIEMLLR